MIATEAERPTRSIRKARGSGHLRRAELLVAAERIFKIAGYDGATIRKIADEVGVSSTALYMYFQDKSEIMLEICLHALEGLHASFEEIAAANPEPMTYLRLHLERFLRFGFEQPTAYELLYCIVPKDVSERRHRVAGPLNRKCFMLCMEAVEAGMAGGGLRGDLEPRVVTEAMIAGCHGAITMRLANPHAPWADSDLLSRTVVAGLFDGFKA